MYTRLLLVVAALLGMVTLARADDKEEEAIAKALSKYAQLGPGVYAIKKDNKGRIASCIIVGQARVSLTLGKAKGLQIARDRAQLNAKSEFVKWLNEKTSVYQKSEDETILFVEGAQDNDQNALKESGKAVEKTSTNISTVAQGLIRGFQLLHTELNAEDQNFTILYGWDAETAAATKGVENANTGKGSNDVPSKSQKSKSVDKLENKKSTSPDAKKFLPGSKQ